MLPIKKVILYKHGVGYFELQGEIEDDAVVELAFKSDQMNDILKSLTVVDLSGGVVSSISYDSTIPLAKQLEDIAIDVPDKNAQTGLLSQLKGASVRITIGSDSVEGSIVGIETKAHRMKGEVVVYHALSLLVNGESLQSFSLDDVKDVQFLDDHLKKDLQHLLGILITGKKKELKGITIFTKGEGKRELLASYTIETPVWKTSYRIILQEKRPSLLQGWALVDNTQDEDWEDVSLTLVAGLPISFVHDLYSPRYKKRPVVEVREDEPEYDVEALESAAAPVAACLDMEEVMVDSFDTLYRKMTPDEAYEARAASVQIRTKTAELGSLFQYEIEHPVTVKRSQSALVPILQAPFEGERVVVFNEKVRGRNPMAAIFFKNTTKLTLEGGPVTVLEDDTYAGESMLASCRPDQESTIPFAVELGCTVEIDSGSDTEDVHGATIVEGVMSLHRYRIEKRIYKIRNSTKRKLDMFLDHPRRPKAELVNDKRDLYSEDQDVYRFRLAIKAGEERTFTVQERRALQETTNIGTVDRKTIGLWLKRKYIDKKTKEQIEAIVAKMSKVEGFRESSSEHEKEMRDIRSDQGRLRENLQALGSTTEEAKLRERYVAALDGQETRLAELQAAIDKDKAARAKAEQEAAKAVKALKFSAML